MSAANYDFSIEQGSSHRFALIYKDADGNVIDITNWCARLIMKTAYKDIAKKNLSSYITFTTNNTDYSLYKFSIDGPNGRIVLQIPSDVTNDYDFDTAKYDLELQSPDDFYSGGGHYTLRIMYGTISIIKRNSQNTLPLDCQNYVPPIVTISNGTDGYYATGDNIDISVLYNGSVVVNTGNGMPSIDINIGDHTETANYHHSYNYTSHSGNTALVFQYLCKSGDYDDNGVNVPQGSINLNGGTITSNGNNVVLSFQNSTTNSNAVVYSGYRPTLTNFSGSISGGLSGVVQGLPYEITYSKLLGLSNATNINSFLIQSVFNGELSKWNGSGWIAINQGTTTVSSGEKIQWIPNINSYGITDAFSLRAMNGLVGSKKIISSSNIILASFINSQV